MFLVCLFISACGAGQGSPDGTVILYIEGARQKNQDGRDKQFRCLCRKDREEAKARNGKMRRGMVPSNFDSADITYSQPVINDDGTALVTVTTTLNGRKGSGGKYHYVLIQEDGQWVISTDKTLDRQRDPAGGGARDFNDGEKE